MNIDWFYSDPHFNHKHICDYANRPWTDVADMNEALIERYNQMVHPGQFVLWLGDCFFGSFEEARVIMSTLHGEKGLVCGNHDRNKGRMAKLGFTFAVDELTMFIGGRIVKANHYPYWRRRRADENKRDRFKSRRPIRAPGQVLIHGHTHQTTPRIDNMINVGVDAWGYYPVRMSDVEELVREV